MPVILQIIQGLPILIMWQQGSQRLVKLATRHRLGQARPSPTHGFPLIMVTPMEYAIPATQILWTFLFFNVRFVIQKLRQIPIIVVYKDMYGTVQIVISVIRPAVQISAL